MSRARDRTEDFKDVVRHTARSFGYDEAKLASVMASFIVHKPRQRSPFSKAALKTLESIGELEQFLMKHRKDYTDLHRPTEQERDSIEHEVSYFIKTRQKQIDVIKNTINHEEENSKGWLGIASAKSNADSLTPMPTNMGCERLHSVSAQFDQLRAVRFQDAVNRAIPRRKLNRVTKKDSAETSKSDDVEFKQAGELCSEPLRAQQQFLDDETRALQVELNNVLDTVRETETRMVEMSALNHLKPTHVLQQAQQIEHLYEQAVEATKNVELGNKELLQAIQRNSSSRTFLLMFLFVLTFSILFLDWYS